MKRKLQMLLVSVALLAVGFIGGYGVASIRVFRWMHGVLATEVGGSLSMHLEALARYRTGDPEGAVSLIELMVDSAVDSLTLERPWPFRMETDSFALREAKLYREVFPNDEADESVIEAYERISDEPIDASSCSRAVKELVKLAEEARQIEGKGGS